jgi:hypothetical protein
MVSIKQAIHKLKKQYYTNNRDSNLKRKKQRYSTDQAYRELIIERAKQNSKMCYLNDELANLISLNDD